MAEKIAEEQGPREEDKVEASEPHFGSWKNGLLAQTNALRMILTLADLMDKRSDSASDGDNSDAEFEDCDDESINSDDENQNGATVIDLDASQKACLNSIMNLFDHILLRTQPINHIIGLARSTEDALDELQEAAFGVLTSLLVS